MTTDNEAARGEDQVAAQREDMAPPRGGKGPTAASATDTQGAFGDATGERWTGSATEDAINQGTAFEHVGGDDDEELRP